MSRTRLRGLGLGMLLLLPHLPALTAYLASRHLGFGTFNLSKVLIVGYLGWLLARFPAGRPRGGWRLAAAVGPAGIAVWTQLAGFSAWALLFGLASLVLWRHFGLPRAGRRNLEPIASLLIAAVILLPLFQTEVVGVARAASMALVDLAVAVFGLPIERQGLSFLVGATDAAQVTIWQRCSGTATTRVLFVLLAGQFLLLGSAGRALLLAPLQAIAGGLICNALRIVIYLLLTLGSSAGPSDLVHQGLGMGLFVMAVAGLSLWNGRALSRRPREVVSGPGASRIELAGIGAAAIAVTAAVGLAEGADKQMDHAYSVYPDRTLRRVHVNHFVEHRGGGGWILLEHPVETCLRARGQDVDTWESRLAGDEKRLLIDQRYRIGDREYRRRATAALAKWARPDFWTQPVQARIRLFEARQSAWREPRIGRPGNTPGWTSPPRTTGVPATSTVSIPIGDSSGSL